VLRGEEYNSKADVFSLGCVLYEAITGFFFFFNYLKIYLGRTPFENSNGLVNIANNANAQYQKIEEDECDKDISELCHSMLSLVCFNFVLFNMKKKLIKIYISEL
jgi:serine/threonine protein kinase